MLFSAELESNLKQAVFNKDNFEAVENDETLKTLANENKTMKEQIVALEASW